MNNIDKLKSFYNPKQDWNGYNADPPLTYLINKCIELIPTINIPIHIFPTARDSIQFEYETDEKYLEIEICINKIDYYYINKLNRQEFEEDDVEWDKIFEFIKCYI